MANKYKTANGSYFIKRSAKAYDADNSSDKEKKGTRQEMERRSNISRDARKVLSEDEQEQLASKSGIAGVSTGGGDPLPKGSKDNEFLVAEDAEEAEEMREMTNGNIPVRVQQERNKDGTFAGTPQEKDEKGNKIRNDPDKVTHTAVQGEDVFEMLGISPEEAEKRLSSIGYSYDEFKQEMLGTYGQIKSRVEDPERARINKRIAVLRKIREDKAEKEKQKLEKQKAKEKEEKQAQKEIQQETEQAQKYEEEVKADTYDYEGKTGHSREYYVENARFLSDIVNEQINNLVKKGVDVTKHLAALNSGSDTKGRQQVYGPQGLARFMAWNKKRKEKNSEQPQPKEEESVQKESTESTPTPSQTKKTADDFKKEERAKQIYQNVPKAKENAYNNLNKLLGSKKFADRARNLAAKLKEADRKGQDTVPTLMEIEELINEYKAMKAYQLEK